MASLQERNGSYRIIFRHHGKQYFVTIGKVARQEAEAISAQDDYLLLRLWERLIELPPGVGIVDFVQYDGKPPAPTEGASVASPVAKSLAIGTFRDHFLEARRGGREESTQRTSRIHFKHLIATFGERYPLPELTQADLQWHIDRRAGIGISATTIKKELATFRTAWHWRIESMHWVLDVNFGEDEHRTRERTLGNNLSWLRRFAVTLLKRHPDKDSLRGKIMSCMINTDYPTPVLSLQPV